ncbi:MAG: lipopolysaccharide biosynthesis protein [Methylobacter sp.]
MSALPYSGAAFKRGVVHFIIGKFTSALLSVGILFWLVRLLAVEEYGTYVTLQAGMGLGLAVMSFGLPWVAARYLPEFRLYAKGQQLARFVWQIIALSGLFSVAGALLLYVAMPWLLASLDLTQQTDVAKLYLLVFMLEGLRLNTQDCILDPLLQQGRAQFSLVARNLTLLLFLGAVLTTQGAVHLQHVVLAELAGSFLSVVLSLYGVVRYLRAHLNLKGKKGWQPSNWSEMWLTARHMYFSYLVTLTYGPWVFVFLTQRFLGLETTALFGFLTNLYAQIYRYLPATLLFSLIRPKLVASYIGEGGMAQLTRNANLAGKISLFILMPLLVCVWLTGSELVSLLSGGKFTQAGYYFGCMLLGLIPLSQRQTLETVVVASGHGHLCFRCSALGILVLPLAYWLFESGQGLWSPVLAMIASQTIFNVTLIVAMGTSTSYRPDVMGLFKLLTAALVGFVLSIFLKMAWTGSFQLHANDFVESLKNIQDLIPKFVVQQVSIPVHGWLDLAATAALASSLYLLASCLFKPFRVDERMRLSRLLFNTHEDKAMKSILRPSAKLTSCNDRNSL